MSSGKRRVFSDDFKKEAVQLIVDKGYSLREASEALGVSQNSLSNWRKKFNNGTSDTDLEKENRRLRKEIHRLNEEREILKKALGYFAAEDPK